MSFILQRLLRALVFVPGIAFAQWEPFNGPTSDQVIDIEVLGDEIYAGTTAGVSKSTDDGTSWSNVDDGLPGDIFYLDLVSTGEAVFALARTATGDRILKSRDQGKTWMDVSAGLPDHLTQLTNIDDTIFASGSDSRFVYDEVFRLVDGDEEWTRILLPDLDLIGDLVVLAAHDGYLFAVADDHILRSSNHGDTWDIVARPPVGEASWTSRKRAISSEVEIYTLSSLGGDLYLGAKVHEPEYEEPLRGGSYKCEIHCRTYEAIFKSSDNGNTWDLLKWQESAEYPRETAIINFVTVQRGDDLYIGSPEGVFRFSHQWGWQSYRDGLPAEVDEQTIPLVSALAVLGDRVFAGTWDGVYALNDEKDLWQTANAGLPTNTYIESLAVVNDALYASLGAHGIYRTKDGAWELVHRASDAIEIRGLSLAADTLFADTRQGLYRLNDAGTRWSALKPYSVHGTRPKVTSTDGDLLLAANHRVYMSSDDGHTWTRLYAPYYFATYCFLANGPMLFLCPYERSIARSIDGGQSWTNEIEVQGLRLGSRETVSHLTELNDKLFVSHSDAISMSLDDGDTWITINEGLPSPPFLDASPERYEPPGRGTPPLFRVQDSLFVSTEAGVSLFDESTESWVSINGGLPPGELLDLDGSEVYLFAHIPGHGIWRLSPAQLNGD